MDVHIALVYSFLILIFHSTENISGEKIEKENIVMCSQTCPNSFLYFIAIPDINEPKCHASRTFSKLINNKDNISVLFSHNLNLQNLYTSVWCTSSDISGLRCKFDNLCYFSNKKQFIFVSNQFSVLYGVRSLLKLSTELFSSSVKNHTAFKVNFAAIGSSSIENYKIKFVNQRVLLFSRFKPDNLQHVFHDDLLPLYFTLRELSTNNIKRGTQFIIPIIIDKSGSQEYDFLYKSVSNNLYFISDFPSDSLICFAESHIGLNLMSVFYDYSTGAGDENYQKYFNNNLLDSFVQSFTSSFDLSSRSCDKIGTIKIVILHRKATRKILNLEDVKKSVYSHIKYKRHLEPIVKVMSLEDDGILSIIEELQTTRILVGMHGAALILSIFMPKPSSLIELWPYGIKPAVVPVYKIICKIKGIDYHFWVNEDIQNSKVHPEYPKYYGGIENWIPEEFPLLIEKLKRTVLEKVQCCDNPEWLLRIYQDTLVNVYSSTDFKSKTLQHTINNVLNTWDDSIHKTTLPQSYQYRYLSQVEDATCNMYHDELGYTKIILTWNKPWNYIATDCKELTFELIILEIDEIHKNHGIYYTKEQTFMKRLTYKAFNFHVWVTPLCMGEQGSEIFINCK